MSFHARQISNLLVHGIEFTDIHRKRLEPYFTQITHVRNATDPVNERILAEADVIFGFPLNFIRTTSQVPRLQFIQLTSAGSERLIASSMWNDEDSSRIKVANAAGAHTGPIPQHFIMTTLALFHSLPGQVVEAWVEKRWPGTDEFGGGHPGHQPIRGKTFGFLGYGHIGREAARLSAAFGAKVLAATPSGTKKPQEGYIFSGTGDPDGSLPSGWYSTSEADSLAAFLSQCDVILLSLPSTPATRRILNASTMAHLKPSVVIVNVGRGDAIETDALVAALDEGRVAGAALDVTDPEPLPNGHPLFGRPNVIITPHVSGWIDGVLDIVIDIFTANLQRWTNGQDLWNIVDHRRGY